MSVYKTTDKEDWVGITIVLLTLNVSYMTGRVPGAVDLATGLTSLLIASFIYGVHRRMAKNWRGKGRIPDWRTDSYVFGAATVFAVLGVTVVFSASLNPLWLWGLIILVIGSLAYAFNYFRPVNHLR